VPASPMSFCGLPMMILLTHSLNNNTSNPIRQNSTWLKGADKGPAAIIEASKYLELYDIETDSEVYKRVFLLQNLSVRLPSILLKKTDTQLRISQRQQTCSDLGGDIRFPVGVNKVYAKHYKDLSILHLDAHADRIHIGDPL